MKKYLLLCMITFLGLLGFSAQGFGTEAPPNVIFIISDDHGWTDYGFMGHTQVHTPHLDKLAAQSLTFRRGYVPSSLCCPSLATMITGRFPHQHKVTSNDPPIPAGMKPGEFQKSPAFLAGREVMNKHLETVPTLPRLLGEKGYLSLQTGKWWQGDYRRGGFTHGMTKGIRHGDEGLDIGRKTLEPITDFINDCKKTNKPFFVWYAPMMPHTPHNPPERFLAKYKEKTPSIHVARYWAMIEWFDESCGQLLNLLDREKLAENTIIVYLADNGWTQNPDAGDSIRSKRTPYDAGLRTPIMVRWPAKVKPRSVDTPVMSVDLLPTIRAALGMPRDAELPGLNLLDEKAVDARKTVFGACFTHNAVDLNNPAKNVRHRWATDGRWKIIVPHGPADKDGPGSIELYDLQSDPGEKANLIAKSPENATRLQKALDEWWTPAK